MQENRILASVVVNCVRESLMKLFIAALIARGPSPFICFFPFSEWREMEHSLATSENMALK
jgi:hypothetical protein